MTIVNFRRSVPQADGSTAPADGYFRFTPSKPRTIPGSPDNIVVPKPFTVDLADGLAAATLAPTAIGSAWQILESIDGVPDLRYWVVVPDSAEPLDDPDLTRVDPSTLTPQAMPEAAWWAAAAVPPGVAWVYIDTDGTPYFEGN
jgi:hypothetical protein